MARKSPNRMVRAVTDVMWKRDQLQMRAVDALLSPIERRRKRAKATGRRRPAARKR